jgi:coenzyme F420 hydrogenase subunit delta
MSIISQIQTARTLVLGCGNTLLGDDGFGPAVIETLKKKYDLPPEVHAEDVGTSVGEILFDIAVSEKRPAHIVLVDTIDREGRSYGEVFEVDPNDLSEKDITSYSLHQAPTSNLLREIQKLCGIRVTVIAAQMPEAPERLTMELSENMKKAVSVAAQTVYELALTSQNPAPS